MKINHAILHVFDFNTCVNTFSSEELDLTDKSAKRYVTRQARRALHNIESKRGSFQHDSAFASELERYLHGQSGFVDLSVNIGEYLAGEIGHMEEPVSTDLLVIDFEDDSNAKVHVVDGADGADASDEPDGTDTSDDADGVGDLDTDDDAESLPAVERDPWDDVDGSDSGSATSGGSTSANARSAVDAAIDASFRGKGKRYIAVILLEIKPAFMHEAGHVSGSRPRNDIVCRHAVLPSPSQKVASYAVVAADSLDVLLCDKPRTIAGEQKMLLADGLLQCSAKASVKETFAAVTQVVEELADEFGQNSAVALSKAKHYAAECDDGFDTEDLGREVFGDDTVQQRRFSEAVGEGTLPDHVRVDPAVSERITKSHKIRTDTGIEITFPSEYCDSPDFIEFIKEPNGMLSIELKNITHIENH